ncbi:MAG TPA: thioredoxin [Cytophagales bacterium]|nr:thioredoxin [Cytophagales bacterium]
MAAKKSFNELIQDEKPVLVDFFAEWCGPCKMMAPVLQEFSKEMGDKVKVIKVDVDKNQNAAMAYQIQGVPTLILFQKGKVIWRQSGAVPGHQLRSVVAQYLPK